MVWSASLKQENKSDTERVQKAACRVIFGYNYQTYTQALDKLNLDTLEKRRQELCLNFTEKCLVNERTSEMFPRKSNKRRLKIKEIFKNTFAKTERLKKSCIPQLQRMMKSVEVS